MPTYPLIHRVMPVQVLALCALFCTGAATAQGYANQRPWARLPYTPEPQYYAEQPKRYNPWAQMGKANRLPPPDYHGEADENAPTYDQPDPAYRELPEQREVLSDPRAYASPWSKDYAPQGYGYTPYYPMTPWHNPYPGLPGIYPHFSPWLWRTTPAGAW